MAVTAVNLSIQKGTDFSNAFIIKNSDGSVKDLTGFTGISSIAKYSNDATAYAFTVGIASTAGRVTISMGRSDTAKLESGRNYYDVVLVSAASTYTKEIEGSVIVSPTISV